MSLLTVSVLVLLSTIRWLITILNLILDNPIKLGLSMGRLFFPHWQIGIHLLLDPPWSTRNWRVGTLTRDATQIFVIATESLSPTFTSARRVVRPLLAYCVFKWGGKSCRVTIFWSSAFSGWIEARTTTVSCAFTLLWHPHLVIAWTISTMHIDHWLLRHIHLIAIIDFSTKRVAVVLRCGKTQILVPRVEDSIKLWCDSLLDSKLLHIL